MKCKDCGSTEREIIAQCPNCGCHYDIDPIDVLERVIEKVIDDVNECTELNHESKKLMMLEYLTRVRDCISVNGDPSFVDWDDLFEEFVL